MQMVWLERRAVVQEESVLVENQTAVAVETDVWAPVLTFREMLVGLPGVEALQVQKRSWGFTLWVIVNNSTEDTRYRIYDAQLELIEKYPEVGFNFNVFERHNNLSPSFADIEFTIEHAKRTSSPATGRT